MDINELLKNPDIVAKLKDLLETTEVEETSVVKKKGRKSSKIKEDDEDVDVIDLTNKPAGKRVKGKTCHRVPLQLGKKINKFVDDKITAIEDYEKFDSKIKRGPKPQRPKPKKYKIKCCRCHQIHIVTEDFLPTAFEMSDEGSSNYTCDNCIPGR